MERTTSFKPFLSILIYILFFGGTSLNAQLNETFIDIFDNFLSESALQTSPGEHAGHFKEASERANNILTPALSRLVTNNIASFPLSATAVGVNFDLSTGQPVSIVESLGPIFSEVGRTLGKGKINAGINYTLLGLEKFRGLKTEDIRFTFTHKNVDEAGPLGDDPNESDIMDVFLDLDVDASIFAFFATMGVTDNLDIGVAIPMINVSMSGQPSAVVHSFTFAQQGTANHNFDTLASNPVLVKTGDRYDKKTAGIGDLTVRLKYSFLRGRGINLATLLDVRLPTGDEENFLGTGNTNARLIGIMSGKIGDFTPHLNLGYDYRGDEKESDEVEFAVGFDQKLVPGLTFAVDFLGEINLEKEDFFNAFAEKAEIRDQAPGGGQSIRTIDLSNIPNRSDENIYNAAFGLRFAPSENLILLGNVLLPLNDAGLRSNIAATFGLAVYL